MGKRRQEQINVAVIAYNEKHVPDKLSPKKVKDIRKRLKNNETHKSIAILYSVDRTSISHIKSGRMYPNIK